MRAVVCPKYGPPEVLQIEDVEKPSPKSSELLIKIHYTTVHIGDTKIRRLEPGMGKTIDVIIRPLMRLAIGISGPRKKILGIEFSGVIEEIGKNVSKFNIGDKVFGSTEMKMGTYAEYCCVSEKSIVNRLPMNFNHKESVSIINGATTALYCLKKGKPSAGKKVLIYGASGSVGSYAVQIAKYFDTTVTAVCSKGNFDLVKSLGADSLIDYKSDDFTENGESYDIIFDAVGKIASDKRKKSLAKYGKYINVFSSSLSPKKEDIEFVLRMCEEGKLRAAIDRTYPLDQIVEAHRYVDLGHKKGNVLISLLE